MRVYFSLFFFFFFFFTIIIDTIIGLDASASRDPLCLRPSPTSRLKFLFYFFFLSTDGFFFLLVIYDAPEDLPQPRRAFNLVNHVHHPRRLHESLHKRRAYDTQISLQDGEKKDDLD